ncbi:MAG TPA: guanylate kinase [Acidimicrobiales bacterium]|nr:guanylate kinase [Acidimicrobiales bacterium]
MLIGPGGAGKGTVAERLVEEDPTLWLSRSWTTRERRDGESPDAYVFVDDDAFRAHAQAGGFLEWAEFLGHRYGTPNATPPAGTDVLLEIDIQGARQVVERRPEAVVILLLPPSPEVQAVRLQGRGDSATHVAERIEKGVDEVRHGMDIARHVVVNDDVERATAQVAGIVARARSARRPA